MLSRRLGLGIVGVTLILAGCARASVADKDPPPAPTPPPGATGDASSEINPRLLRRFQPIDAALESAQNPRTPAKIALGRRLFHENRISKKSDLSCNSCHDLQQFGVDGQATSIGFDGQRGSRNSPTVYNAAASFTQFWDGRAADVEEQAKGPLLNPREMRMSSGDEVVARLKALPGYEGAFHEAFPGEAEPIRFDNVARAIGAFERGLMTPGRWDRFLAGDRGALSAPEKEGLKIFLNSGCMVCHTGPLLGGSMFERVGVVEPWPNQADTGRMMVTHAGADRMMFKVPTLRNVANTGPYFHDGSVATLEGAVHAMGKHQLGLDLTSAEVGSIVVWLRSLTGEVPSAYAAQDPVAATGSATR
ncbi:MAG: cytochrome c peroxidase [Byssovorax sp.]